MNPNSKLRSRAFVLSRAYVLTRPRGHAQTCRLPHGNLSVVYDELGNKYDIPPYCLSDPLNLVKTDGDAPPSSTATQEDKTNDSASDATPEAPPVVH